MRRKRFAVLLSLAALSLGLLVLFGVVSTTSAIVSGPVVSVTVLGMCGPSRRDAGAVFRRPAVCGYWRGVLCITEHARKV